MNVQTIIQNLLSHSFPDNGNINEQMNSWGIGWELEAIKNNIGMFSIYPAFYDIILEATQHLDEYRPQFILDWKNYGWVLCLNFGEDNPYHPHNSKLILKRYQMFNILSNLRTLGIRLYDINNAEI